MIQIDDHGDKHGLLIVLFFLGITELSVICLIFYLKNITFNSYIADKTNSYIHIVKLITIFITTKNIHVAYILFIEDLWFFVKCLQ